MTCEQLISFLIAQARVLKFILIIMLKKYFYSYPTEGVSCLVIDRETFNQLISNLEEVKNKYNDEDIIERRL